MHNINVFGLYHALVQVNHDFCMFNHSIFNSILHIPQGLLFLLVASVNPAARDSNSILLKTCLNTFEL